MDYLPDAEAKFGLRRTLALGVRLTHEILGFGLLGWLRRF